MSVLIGERRRLVRPSAGAEVTVLRSLRVCLFPQKRIKEYRRQNVVVGVKCDKESGSSPSRWETE